MKNKILIILSVSFLLVACGRSGDLFLPSDVVENTSTTESASQK